MSLENSLFTALKSLVNNRVYRDLAPQTVTALPRITFQQVGGEAINFVDNSTVPSIKRARVQVDCWAETRDAAAALSRQVEDALRVVVALQTVVLAAPIARYEPDTLLYGTSQDFAVVHTD